MRQVTSSIKYLLAILFLCAACASTTTIVHGIDEREANEIIVLLSSNTIHAYKIAQPAATAGGGPKIQLWDIAVDASNVSQAMQLLSENGYPKRESPNLLELFAQSGLVPSDAAQKIRYQAGLADTIANTIRKFDGVVDADVVLSFPEEDPLNPNAKKPPITASVYVKHTGILDSPNSYLKNKIKQLVASAVPGLTYDNVSVIGERVPIHPVSGSIQNPVYEYVRVWGLIIPTASLTRFQILFFSMSILLLVFVLVSILLCHKLYPLLKRRGGVRLLFQLQELPDDFGKAPEGEEKTKENEMPPPQEKQEDDSTKNQNTMEVP